MRKAAAASLWMGTCSATAVTCSGLMPDSPLPTISELQSPLLPLATIDKFLWPEAPSEASRGKEHTPRPGRRALWGRPQGPETQRDDIPNGLWRRTFQLPWWGDWLAFHVCSLYCSVYSGTHRRVPVLSRGLIPVCISSVCLCVSQVMFWLWIIGREDIMSTPHSFVPLMWVRYGVSRFLPQCLYLDKNMETRPYY